MSLLLARFVVAAGTDSFTITESTAAAAVTGSGQDSFAVTEVGSGVVSGSGQDSVAVSETGDGAVANSGTDTETFSETGDGVIAGAGTDSGTLSETGDGVLSAAATDSFAITETGDGVLSAAATDSFAITETGDAAVADSGEDNSAIGARPFHELVDPFAGTSLGPQWSGDSQPTASFSVHDGLLELDQPAGSSGSAQVQTNEPFTLAESSVVIEAVATVGYTSLISDWGFFDLAPRDDTVYGFLESGDDSVSFEFAYDPADRFLRWRESAGTVYAETSPDRSTWTERATVPTPPFLTGFLRFQSSSGGVTGTILEVYGVNAHLQSPQGSVNGDSTDSFAVTETGDGAVADSGTDTETFSETGTGAVSGDSTDTGTISETGTGTVTGEATDSLTVTETGDGVVSADGTDTFAVTETGVRRILLGDLRTPQGNPPWDDYNEFYDDDITFSDAPLGELQADSSAAGQFAEIYIGFNSAIEVDGLEQTLVFHITRSVDTVGGYFQMYSDAGAFSFFGTQWDSADFEFEDTAASYTTDEFWVRVVEAAGTLTSETSLDGLTWTPQTSYATPDGWDRLAIDVGFYDDDVGSSVVGINTALAADVVLAGTDSFAITESGGGVVAGDGQDSGTVTDTGGGAIADSGTDTGTTAETGTGAVAGAATDTIAVTETGSGVVSGSGSDSATAVATGDGAVAGAGEDLVTIVDSGEDRVVEPTDVVEEGTDSFTITETGSHDVIGVGPPTAEHAPGRALPRTVPRTPRRPRAPPAGDVVLAGTDVFLITATGERTVEPPAPTPVPSLASEVPPTPPAPTPVPVRAPVPVPPGAAGHDVTETGAGIFTITAAGTHRVTGPRTQDPGPGSKDLGPSNDDEEAILVLLLAGALVN